MISLDDLARTALTFLVGFSAAWLALRLRVPGGAILGPMVVVGALAILGAPLAQLGPSYRLAAQVLVGATLGSTLTRATLVAMIRLAGPAALGVGLLIVLGVGAGWLMHQAAGLPLASALFAGAPGGSTDMALASADLGGDVQLVAALHLVRQFAVVLIVPALLRWRFGPGKRKR